MTPEQQRIAIHGVCPKLFVIKKPIHAPFCYYREKGAGYTDLKSAWRVTKAEGLKYISGRPTDSDRVILEPAPIPDYLNDLNAMFSAFSHLGRHWEISQVHDGYYCRIEFGPKRKDVTVAGLELLPVMSEAFLRTLNLWKS